METAIVTYGRGWPALSAVRTLGERGVRVVCGDSVAATPGTFSRHCARSFRYPDPVEDEAGFLAALEGVIAEEQAAGREVVLVPIHRETFTIAEHWARFAALGVKAALPTAEQIAATHDKGALVGVAQAHGVAIPETHTFKSLEEVYRAAPGLPYPQFVKLREAAAGVGVFKVDDAEELVRVVREQVEAHGLGADDFPIVQGFCPGDDLCVTALFDHGEPVAVFSYRNVRQFPATTGAGVVREAVEAPEAEGEAVRLLRALGWHGIAQLDFRWAPGVAPALIEINPRFFGGLPQAVASGVDYPWLVYQLARGVRETPGAVDRTVRTKSPLLGALATVRDVPPGQGTFAALRAGRGAVDDVWRWSDPLPVLGALLFPLWVLLTRGSLSTAAVLSETAAARPVVAKSFRAHARPSWTTELAALGVAVLLAVLATWQVTANTALGWLADAPARWAAACFPGTGGLWSQVAAEVGPLAFQVVLLHVLAAWVLARRDRWRVARG